MFCCKNAYDFSNAKKIGKYNPRKICFVSSFKEDEAEESQENSVWSKVSGPVKGNVYEI